MLADLAVSPFPVSLVQPPLRKRDQDTLPAVADHHML